MAKKKIIMNTKNTPKKKPKRELFLYTNNFFVFREMERKVQTYQVIEDLMKSEFKQVIEIILCHGGCIFGGFLRDWFLRIAPTDIDVIKRYETFEEWQVWCSKLKLLGYNFSENECGDQIYQGDGLITLHVTENEEEELISPNERLSPCCDPDYNVNFLAFDQLGLYNWVDMSDPCLIIDYIQQQKTIPYKPNETRKCKMQNKPLVILDDVYVFVPNMSKEYISSFMKCFETIKFYEERIAEYKKETSENLKQIEILNQEIEQREIVEKEVITTCKQARDILTQCDTTATKKNKTS